MHASQWWDDTRRDLAQALRQLRRAPSFTVVAALTLALAIGANTAVFSVVDAVLLRPLPYPQPDRLVAVWARFLPPSGYDIPKATLGAGEVLGLERDARTFASMGTFMQGQAVALTGAGLDAQQVGVWQASASLLPALGVTPALGRWFTEDEDAPDAPAVAVISHRLWSSRYGSDPGVVGRSVMMNGVATRVVGVLPVGFSLGMGAAADAYLPLRLTASTRVGRVLGVVARLAPDATLADADRELAALNRRWSEDAAVHPSALWAAPLQADRLGDAPDVLHLLLMAVGLVLLVACANVANLLLARGERRLAEVRLRAALGAGRGRIVRQFVTESLVLAAVASLLALPLAWAGTRSLVALDPSALPRLERRPPGTRGVAVHHGPDRRDDPALRSGAGVSRREGPERLPVRLPRARSGRTAARPAPPDAGRGRGRGEPGGGDPRRAAGAELPGAGLHGPGLPDRRRAGLRPHPAGALVSRARAGIPRIPASAGRARGDSRDRDRLGRLGRPLRPTHAPLRLLDRRSAAPGAGRARVGRGHELRHARLLREPGDSHVGGPRPDAGRRPRRAARGRHQRDHGPHLLARRARARQALALRSGGWRAALDHGDRRGARSDPLPGRRGGAAPRCTSPCSRPWTSAALSGT